MDRAQGSNIELRSEWNDCRRQAHAYGGGSVYTTGARPMKLDDCIAFLAEYGCSKHQVAKLLDIRWELFLGMCKAMPDVQWATRGYTIADRQSRRKIRGKFPEAKREAIAKANEARRKGCMVMAFGKLATIEEHAERMGHVSYDCVLKRMRRGMSLEEALSTPKRGALQK